MGPLAAARDLVARIPDLSAVGVSIEIRDLDGRTVAGRAGEAGASVVEYPLDGGARILCHLGAGATVDLIRPLVDELCRAATDVARLEGDMESMSTSSLALLEHVAMVDELVVRLPACETDEEVIRLGLEHLAIAISVRRAEYLAWDEMTGRCRSVVEVVCEGGTPVVAHDPRSRPFDPAISLVGELLTGGRDEVLEQVPEPGRLGVRGLPEFEASRQFLAVPVRFADGAGERTLGVIAVADQQANSYSARDQLGSHEAKLTATLGRLIGSALGTRSIAAVGKELKLAREIQQQILPAAPPYVQGFDLAGRCATSNAVGGDYYDFVRMADGRTLALVADVSGHNLASGMVMVSVRTALRLLAGRMDDAGLIFSELGHTLGEDLSRTERFISAAGVVLRPRDSAVEVLNAGHVDVLLRRAATGRIERLHSTDTVFGFLRGVEYSAVEVQLEPGDLLLLYTDGVLEAQNPGDEMFGDQRLEALLRSVDDAPAEAVLGRVFDDVSSFVRGGPRTDDVTVLVVRSVMHEGPEDRRR